MMRCALVGTGAVAALHADAIEGEPGASLVAVADRTRSNAERFATTWRVPEVFDTLEQMLAESRPDVLLICTPPAVHREQAEAGFAAGAHVIVEKPAALSLDDLDGMLEAARRAERELAVVFQQRTGTAAARVRELLAAGALGRPLVATCETLWYRDQAYFDVPWRGTWDSEGGGTTLGHGIHQIDLLAYLLGDWSSVQGRLWRTSRQTATEDVSTATVEFADGTVASVVTSAVSPRQVSALRIDTERATIELRHLYGHGHAEWTLTPAPEFVDLAGEWRLPAVEERSGHAALLRQVLQALRVGDPLPPVAANPARSLEIVSAIYASAAAGGAPVTPAALAAHPTHRARLESPVADRREDRA